MNAWTNIIFGFMLFAGGFVLGSLFQRDFTLNKANLYLYGMLDELSEKGASPDIINAIGNRIRRFIHSL